MDQLLVHWFYIPVTLLTLFINENMLFVPKNLYFCYEISLVSLFYVQSSIFISTLRPLSYLSFYLQSYNHKST